ncbi:pyridoxal phosphate-dependent transferase [Limtongia smithiae]|uniref:pyridoxal phosphate-dependent transferase n=1 Tax=Limtongia smithiae TaxID=1125753 RepID=UPI0034CF7D6E
MQLKIGRQNILRSGHLSRCLSASTARFAVAWPSPLQHWLSGPAARSLLTSRFASSAATSKVEAEPENIITNPDPAADSKSAEYIRTYEPNCLTTYARPGIVLTDGKGCYVKDIEGRKYLDFSAGIAVTALGHANEEIAKIVYDQAMKTIHTSNLYYNEWTGRLCKLLIERTLATDGMASASRVFVGNSGSEANEAALKFARKYGKTGPKGSPEKTEVVSFHRSFHGRTFGSLSATPNLKYQKPFAPMVPGFKYATFNDVGSLDLITKNTCGVIIEPIQGEGGIFPASQEFMEALRKKCDEVDAILIFDEIQCGLGRTGFLWAHEAFGPLAQPDIMTTAKALGNGIPIGAAIVSEKVAEVIKIGDHGTTFGGNPFATRVAHYVVEQLSTPEFLDSVKHKAELFRAGLEQLKEKYPTIATEIRGSGLMWGVQLNQDPTPVVDAARLRGLLVITAGENTLRIVPPLVIKEEEILEGLEILESAIASL